MNRSDHMTTKKQLTKRQRENALKEIFYKHRDAISAADSAFLAAQRKAASTQVARYILADRAYDKAQKRLT